LPLLQKHHPAAGTGCIGTATSQAVIELIEAMIKRQSAQDWTLFIAAWIPAPTRASLPSDRRLPA